MEGAFPCLCSYGIKRIEIAFFGHKLIKSAAFGNAAVFHRQNAVVTPQKGFVKGVGDNKCG